MGNACMYNRYDRRDTNLLYRYFNCICMDALVARGEDKTEQHAAIEITHHATSNEGLGADI